MSTMYVLGMHRDQHDASAARIRDGSVCDPASSKHTPAAPLVNGRRAQRRRSLLGKC